MLPYEMLNQKPYTLEVVDNWFGVVKCKILCDETCIREIVAPFKFIKSIVELLNFAYNNGFGSGYVQGQLAELDATNKRLKEALLKEQNETDV